MQEMGNQWTVCCPGVLHQWENQRRRFLEETAAVRTMSELVMDAAHSQEPGGVCEPSIPQGPDERERTISVHKVQILTWEQG